MYIVFENKWKTKHVVNRDLNKRHLLFEYQPSYRLTYISNSSIMDFPNHDEHNIAGLHLNVFTCKSKKSQP